MDAARVAGPPSTHDRPHRTLQGAVSPAQTSPANLSSAASAGHHNNPHYLASPPTDLSQLRGGSPAGSDHHFSTNLLHRGYHHHQPQHGLHANSHHHHPPADIPARSPQITDGYSGNSNNSQLLPSFQQTLGSGGDNPAAGSSTAALSDQSTASAAEYARVGGDGGARSTSSQEHYGQQPEPSPRPNPLGVVVGGGCPEDEMAAEGASHRLSSIAGSNPMSLSVIYCTVAYDWTLYITSDKEIRRNETSNIKQTTKL